MCFYIIDFMLTLVEFTSLLQCTFPRFNKKKRFNQFVVLIRTHCMNSFKISTVNTAKIALRIDKKFRFYIFPSNKI